MKSKTGIEKVKKADLKNHSEIKKQSKKKALENDSDIDGFGYDSSSSDDAKILMYNLETMGTVKNKEKFHDVNVEDFDDIDEEN